MGLTIAEAARQLGLAVDTLRYYEKDGLLLRPVPRSSAGHRRYQAEDLRWIELVTRLRATGMPIREVRRYADLVRAGSGNERERLELLQGHREAVLGQLVEVQAHLAAIEYKIDLYTDRLGAECLSA
ncbi:MerR family transcriptional regulator [Ruania alba]|uniref:DNA-binding transcriptional regulator, MerR family n=1 Tax=Ruania alba TaxID=648782 RepID=A0A1H5LBB0_9MICO|nr:MerR family transcriptional regulator [Ruania alba]SEE73528.1 DNA-binding transcriptional regulator, MerR family [Ruania alba]